MFPGARTARGHCFAEDSFRMRALAKAGIIADSQNPTPCQGYLLPMVHVTGILRLPVYFEDDVAFDAADRAFTVGVFRKTLFTLGLKIFNFHPTFVGCNTPSLAHYNEVRGKVFGSREPAKGVRWTGRGTANMLDELMDDIHSTGYKFSSLHSGHKRAPRKEIQLREEVREVNRRKFSMGVLQPFCQDLLVAAA